MISQAELQFVRNAARLEHRIDGRPLTQIRTLTEEHSILPNCLSSVSVADTLDGFKMITGLKLKVEQLQKNQIIFSLTTTREWQSGQKQEIEAHVQAYLNQTKICQEFNLNSKKLKLSWQVDCLIFQQPALHLLGPVLHSVKFCFQNALIPKINISFNQLTEQQSFDISSESESAHCFRLPSFDIYASVANKIIRDPRKIEFKASEGTMLLMREKEWGRQLSGRLRIERVIRLSQLQPDSVFQS